MFKNKLTCQGFVCVSVREVSVRTTQCFDRRVMEYEELDVPPTDNPIKRGKAGDPSLRFILQHVWAL